MSAPTKTLQLQMTAFRLPVSWVRAMKAHAVAQDTNLSVEVRKALAAYMRDNNLSDS